MKDSDKKKFPWSDFWAIVCGIICLSQGIFFCIMIEHFHSGRLYLCVLADWYTVPQLFLCLSGIFLTVRRFLRKKKGLAFKENEWIPVIVSYAFSLIRPFLDLLIYG